MPDEGLVRYSLVGQFWVLNCPVDVVVPSS